MRCIYNGIDLGVLETYAFDCESVYDDSGTDYLYTKFSMVFRCVVNGTAQVLSPTARGDIRGGVFTLNGPAISYDLSAGESVRLFDSPTQGDPPWRAVATQVTGDPFGDTPPQSGTARALGRLRNVVRTPTPPAMTHAAIRHRLSIPRGKLYVFAGPGVELGPNPGDGPPAGETNPDSLLGIWRPTPLSTLILECPNAGMACDAKNGPSPKILGVHAALGDADTLLIDWACEAYVNEGPQNGVNFAGALLSNRFAQTQQVDEAGYTTAVTAGAAVFRTDLIYHFPQQPDRRRPVLFMPIPVGFVRENVQVTGLPDVTGVRYSYQDRQVPVNFPAGQYARAASIAAVHRQAITTNMDVFEGALSFYAQNLGLKANKFFAKQGTLDHPPGSQPPIGKPNPAPPPKSGLMQNPRASFNVSGRP